MPRARTAQVQMTILLVTVAGCLCSPSTQAIPRKARLSPFAGEPSDEGVLPVRWRSGGVRVAAPTSNRAPSPASSPTPDQGSGEVNSPCTTDEQCGRGTYCQMDRRRCTGIRRQINVLYLFYRSRDRRFTEAMGIYWHRSGERGYRVAFPLYWRFKRQRRDSTVVFPVYWDFARGSRRTTVVVNTLYIRDKVNKTYDFHFLPVVRVQRKRPTDFKISFVAGLFGYERIGANRFLKVFLIPLELKRKAPGAGTARAQTDNSRVPTEI